MNKLYAILTASFLTASVFSARAVELPTGRIYCYPYNVPSDQSTWTFKLATIYDIPSSGSTVDWHAFSSQISGVTEVQSATWVNGQFVALRYNYGTYMYVIDKTDSSWSYTNKTLSTQFPGGATDLTVDPKTGEVYGWFWKTRSLYAMNFQLAKLDVTTGEITPVGQTCTSYITGLSFDSSGTLWGITQEGQLEKISTTDGTLTDVGAPISELNWTVTEIRPQSMCYDSASGKMLYSHIKSFSSYSASETALYAIDLSDQTATQLYSLNGAFLAGLYSPSSFDAAAPGEVADLKASNDGVSTDISLSFTMPSKTFGGTTLTSAKYTVLLDGEATSHKDVSAKGGSQVNLTLASTAGTHSVTVYCSNLSGDGPEVSTDIFVGPDTPASPRNVRLTFDGRTATIVWEAPSGKNGGKYDESKIVYKVTRVNDDVVVAASTKELSAVDNILEGPVRPISYNVTVIYDGTECESALSNTEYGGDPLEITPSYSYSENFTDVTDYADAGIAVVSINSTNPTTSLTTANGNTYLTVVGNGSQPRIFMPAMLLKAKHIYKVSFDWMYPDYGYVYGMPFGFGLTRSPLGDADEVKNVVPSTTVYGEGEKINTFSDITKFSVEFTIDETGTYFPMICIGNSLRFTYAVDNLLVEDVTAPGTPLEITGMTAENTVPGSRDIIVSFTLPTLDTSDAPANINKVELKRNDEVINTWTDGISDGQTLSYTDINAPLGTVSYSAVAYNAQGASVPATANAKSGLDYDLAVADISADPVKVIAGETFTIKATVLNNGNMPTPDDDSNRYSVVLIEVTDEGRIPRSSSFGDRLMSGETAEISFICATGDESVGVHRFEVSAIFPDATLDENNENNLSKPVEVVVEPNVHDGIDTAAIDSAIEINGREITLRVAGTIYNVAGVCVFTNCIDAPRSVTLTSGIYLISIDNKIFKVTI